MANLKRTRTWLVVAAWWAYFVTAVMLYHRGVIWANTVDLLAGGAVLLAVATWFVVDRLGSRAGYPSWRWGTGPWGVYRREDVAECNSKQ